MLPLDSVDVCHFLTVFFFAFWTLVLHRGMNWVIGWGLGGQSEHGYKLLRVSSICELGALKRASSRPSITGLVKLIVYVPCMRSRPRNPTVA
jgi:hypothetical protein